MLNARIVTVIVEDSGLCELRYLSVRRNEISIKGSQTILGRNPVIDDRVRRNGTDGLTIF